MKLENVIQIDAPPDVVWATTVDVERWPEWTPTVETVKREDQGEFAVGSAALIKQPGLPEARWVVTSLTPGERFTWETRVRGIHIIGTHEIRTVPKGSESVLRLELSGIVVWLLWPLIRSRSGKALIQENAGLKTWCEDRRGG